MDHGLEYLIKQYGPPKLIHAHFTLNAGRVALRWKREKGWPYVITEHSTNFSTLNVTWKIRILRQLAKAAIKSAEHMMPVSFDLAGHMQLDNSKTTVIPNAVFKDFFLPRVENHIPRIIHVSSFDEDQKNISGLLRALAKIDDSFELRLIGTANHAYVKSLVDKYNFKPNKVKIKGPASIAEVAEECRQSDIVVLFSRYENLPCVLLEAQCAGVYCISSDVGGVREIIDDEKVGLLVQSENEAQLTEAVKKALHHEIDTDYIRSYAANKYSDEQIKMLFQKVYHKVLSNG